LISKIFPIIDIIYGPLLEQLESKEMQRGYKATEKLNEIERGLEQYQTLMCFVDEENYNSALEDIRGELSNDNDPRRRKKSHEEIEEDAKDFADSHICQNAKTCIDRLLIRQCCKHFLNAYRINLSPTGMRYDPERVEIEDPLMHGEPYPEII
jgi:hypothetical protein